jgi:hypothetical protein
LPPPTPPGTIATLPLVFIVIGLALFDGLNPFTFAVQGYLLTTARWLRLSVVFLVATFVTYYIAGILLLQGWIAAIRLLLPRLPDWSVGAAEAIAGVGVLIAGVWLWRRRAGSKHADYEPRRSLDDWGVVGIATATTAASTVTGAPYIAAANRLAAADVGLVTQLALLSAYNALYVSPLIGLVLARGALGSGRALAVLGWVQGWVEWVFNRVLPPCLVVAGVVLIGDGIRRLLWAA